MVNDASLSSLQLLHKTAQMFKQNVTSQAQITGTPVYSKSENARCFKAVLVNLFSNRTHFQLLLKSLYTPVFTTQYIEIASMLMEKMKHKLRKIFIYTNKSFQLPFNSNVAVEFHQLVEKSEVLFQLLLASTYQHLCVSMI